MKSTEDYLDSLLAGAIRNNRNLNESFDESDKNDSTEDSFSRENEGKHKYSVRSEESRSSESALDELLKNAMLPPKTQRDYLREEAEAEAEAEAESEKTIIYEKDVEPEEESPLLNLDEEMDEKIPEEISLEVPDQEVAQNDDATEASSEALFGDSSKMMSLDEIAAIIASAGTDLEDSSTDIKGYEEPLEDIDSLADSFGDIDLSNADISNTDLIEASVPEMTEENVFDMPEESFSDIPEDNITDMPEENFSNMSDEGVSELIEEPVAAMPEESMIDSLADDLVIGDLDTASHTEEYAGIDGDMTLGELMPDLFGSPEEDEDSDDSMMSAGDVLMQGGLSSASDEEAPDIDEEKAEAISDDPNKQLNQDDIAALINQLHQDDAEEETAPASNPASLDDPNKMMSQDDVAALLANMSLDEDDNKEIEAMEIADAFEKIDEDESGEDESAEDLSEEKPVEEENIDIDAKTNDLMALLLDDDSDKSDASNGDEGFDNINDQLNGLEDMSEDDIEAMLKAAENTEGGSSSVSDGDVVDIVEAIGGDEDTKEVASLLKSVDDNEIVDESFLDKLDKAEADGENQEPDAENGDGKKKKKKKGLLSKLFGKKDADDEASEGTGTNPENAEGSSETGDGEQAPAADKADKKEKKPGFFTKLLNLLTEEVEEEVSVPEAGSNLISDENKAILEELDAEDGGKKKKKGKKGKGKDEGEKKPKKEKKPKAPKPKKEKLLEPKDKTKQIPKKYIMASVLVAASLLAILILITSYMPKLMTMQSARDAYYSKDYKTAFYTLYGKDLNESDELIYNKAKTIILVERKLESFENYSMLGMRLEALDALLSGLQRYEDLKDEATEYNVIDEITDIRIQILNALSSNFGISESEAMSILELDELNYYRMINSIVNGTPYISAEDEVNMMYGITTDAPVSYDGSSTGYDSNEFPDLLPEEADYLNGNYEDTDVPEESSLQFLNPEDAEGFNTQHGAVEEADPIDPEIIIESNQF